MEIKRGFEFVSQSEISQIISAAAREGIATFTLSTGSRVDRETFFQAVSEALPLDPPLQTSRSWDAISDSMWGGLHEMAERRVVIVWADAAAPDVEGQQDLQIALSILQDLVKNLADFDATVGAPTDASVYVATNAEPESKSRPLP